MEDLIPTVHLRDPNTGELLGVVPADEAEGWRVRLEGRKAALAFKAPKWPDKPLERGARQGGEIIGAARKPQERKHPRGPWDPGWSNPKPYEGA